MMQTTSCLSESSAFIDHESYNPISTSEYTLSSVRGGSQCDEINRDVEETRCREFVWVMCNAIGIGECYSPEQVAWIKGYLTTLNCSPTLLHSVDQRLRDASSLPDVELAWETAKLQELKRCRRSVMYDLYRAASMNNFREQQMCAISMVGEALGVSGKTMDQLKAYVECQNALESNRFHFL